MRFSEEPGKRDRVRVFDLDTKTITFIPADELAPGMVNARVEGIEGEVWIDSSKLALGDYRHPPFEEDIRDFLREIKAALDEVYPISLEKWEDDFRRDENVEQEIALWLHLARTYAQLAASHAWDAARKDDAFQILLSCTSSPPAHVLSVVRLKSLSQQEAEAVIRAFCKPAA